MFPLTFNPKPGHAMTGSQYSEPAMRVPLGDIEVFTQQTGESTPPLENPLTGSEQSVGPDDDSTQRTVLATCLYPLRGGNSNPSALGMEHVTGPDEAGEASAFPSSTSFGSDEPPSQPAPKSARARMPKKKFFIFCPPFLGYNFPHPEQDVNFSFLMTDASVQIPS